MLQETHVPDELQMTRRATISGYTLISALYHRSYGSATYVRNDIKNWSHLFSTSTDTVYIIAIRVAEITILNIYKLPNEIWPTPPLPVMPHQSIYIGDFNSHHTSWGYDINDNNGEILYNWMDSENMQLVFNAKDRKTFHSGRWDRGYNPDLCIVSKNKNQIAIPAYRTVLNNFPRSQHRPILINVGIQIPIVKTIQKPRWNFRKADWHTFAKSIDANIRWIKPTSNNYDRFVGIVKGAVKRCVPRGYRRDYIPCWNPESNQLYTEYQKNGTTELADMLLTSLAKSRKDRWIETMEKLDFKHSSREAWNLLRRLDPNPTRTKSIPKIKPGEFANRIIEMTRASMDKETARKVTMNLKNKKRETTDRSKWAENFVSEEVQIALKSVKTGKTVGLDGIHPEFLKNCGPNTRKWLADFFSDILCSGKLPK